MTAGAAGNRAAGAVWLGAIGLAAFMAIPLGNVWRLAPDLGHGWAAPLLMAYLWWERWAERPALHPRPLRPIWWAVAGMAAALALPLRLLLTPFPLWPTLVWAYVLLLTGLGLAAAGLLAGRAGVRWLGGPLIVLAAALPWGSALEQRIAQPLREGMASATAEVSNALGRPAIALGTTVRLGSGWVGVDEACGGIRSLEASIMLALFFGEWLRFSWQRRAALVGAGVLAALLGNFFRILFLSLRAAAGSAAFFAAHDAAGWLALAFSLALTGLLARWWATHPSPAKSVCAPAGRAEPSAPGRGGAVVWLLAVVALLAGVETAVRGWYAHGAALAASVPRWTARIPENAANFQAAPALSEEAQELLLPDRYVAGSWAIGPHAVASAYYIEWQKGQVARFVPFLHNPTVCLPLSGCELEKSLGTITATWTGGEIPFHAYIFRRAGEQLAVAFAVWDTSRGQPLEKVADDASWGTVLRERWKDVSEAREDQPAQMLSLAVSGPAAEERLKDLLDQLVGPS